MIRCNVSNRVFFNEREVTDPFLKFVVTSTAIVIAGIATAGALTLTGVILAKTGVIVGRTLTGVATLVTSPVTIPLSVLRSIIHGTRNT